MPDLAQNDARPTITGLGLATPIGCDPSSFWDSLIAGRSGAREVRSFDTSHLGNRIGCEIEDYALPDEARESLLGGRCTELALLAAAQAVEHARLIGPDGAGPADLAIVVGSTMGDVTQFERDRVTHSDREADATDVRSLAMRPIDVMGRSVSRFLCASGPVLTVPAACAAGSYAIGIASSLVARGKAAVALALGCEAFSRLAFVGFSRMHAMSPDHCRPFSGGRPGLLLGEGAGAVVIESQARAKSRGARPLGFVDGFGISCDAYHVTGPHPQGDGALRAMADAVDRAQLTPDRIDYINAHGTGTPLNDKTESLAIHRLLGDRARSTPVSSIKALTGHMMGAAGAVEAIACLLAIEHQVVPPTWNWVQPDPECDIDCVPNAPRPARLRHVLSNSYAFGGNNASLLISAP